MNIKAIVRTARHSFTTGEDFSAILALLIMIGLVNLAIVLRIAINYESSAWEEVARFASLWVYLVGVVIASKENSHLRMGFLKDRIHSTKTKLAMEMVFDLISTLCMGIFAWWSAQYLIWSIATKQTSLVLMVDMWVVHSSFVVGSSIAMIHILFHLINSTRKFLNFVRGAK